MEGFVTHTLQPVYDKNSNVLILGTIPSPKSREYGFYYGHRQNRFWKVLAALFQAEIPIDNESKKQFVLSRHIALWDVLASCTISGASDSSIKTRYRTTLAEFYQKQTSVQSLRRVKRLLHFIKNIVNRAHTEKRFVCRLPVRLIVEITT